VGTATQLYGRSALCSEEQTAFRFKTFFFPLLLTLFDCREEAKGILLSLIISFAKYLIPLEIDSRSSETSLPSFQAELQAQQTHCKLRSVFMDL
jgi:hypothetical protein